MSVLDNHIQSIISEIEFELSQLLDDRPKIENFLQQEYNLEFQEVSYDLKSQIDERNAVIKGIGKGIKEKPYTIEPIEDWDKIKIDIQIENISRKQRVISHINQLYSLNEFDIAKVESAAEKLLSKIKLEKLKFNEEARKNVLNVPNFLRYHDLFKLNLSFLEQLEILLSETLAEYNRKFQALRLQNSKIVPSSVFGDNLKIVKILYEWLQDYFLEENIELYDFLLFFNPNNKHNVSKINLMGGNLADYALLISELEILFNTDLTTNRGNYHEWWCKRFFFNESTKSKKDISKLLTKLNSEEIKAKYSREIKELIQSLKDIPS